MYLHILDIIPDIEKYVYMRNPFACFTLWIIKGKEQKVATKGCEGWQRFTKGYDALQKWVLAEVCTCIVSRNRYGDIGIYVLMYCE